MSSRTILVVDDDPLIRKLIATTLEDVAGFRLAEASDGHEAVSAAAAEQPSIVFLDVDMPRLNGIDACREIRRAEVGEGEASTIVMLTAASDHRIEQRSLEAGADVFLTKPFSPLDLLRLVDALGEAS